MNENKREELENRRKELQMKLAVEEFISSQLKPYLEVLDYLKQHQISYRIVQVLYDEQSWLVHLQDALENTPFVESGFQKDHLDEQGIRDVLDKWYDQYPSINSFRYVPELPVFGDYYAVLADQLIRDGLQKAVNAIGCHDQLVYVYHMQYGVVIEVSMSDLVLHDHEDLFHGWHGDVVIFPPKLEWIITFTLEEVWMGGKYESKHEYL